MTDADLAARARKYARVIYPGNDTEGERVFRVVLSALGEHDAARWKELRAVADSRQIAAQVPDAR